MIPNGSINMISVALWYITEKDNKYELQMTPFKWSVFSDFQAQERN